MTGEKSKGGPRTDIQLVEVSRLSPIRAGKSNTRAPRLRSITWCIAPVPYCAYVQSKVGTYVQERSCVAVFAGKHAYIGGFP